MATNLYFLAVLLSATGYALWKGGTPERLVAVIFLLGVLFTRLAASEAAARYSSVEAGILIVDAVMLLALVAIALTADRFWPLWIAALHLIATAGHALKMADPEVIRWAYRFALAFWSYPMLLLLAVGTWNHRKRLRRFGADRSWSSFSSPSPTMPRSWPTG